MRLSAEIEKLPRYFDLPNISVGDSGRIRSLVRIAWQTEVVLRRPRITNDEELSILSIHWGTIQLYYAVYSAAAAWLESARGKDAPKRRRAVLNVLSDVACKDGLFPLPWGAACHSYLPVSFCGTLAGHTPEKVSHLSSPGPGEELDLLCLALKATRRKRLEENLEVWKAKNKMRRVPRRKKVELDQFTCTTVFDLLWDMRVYATYKDAEPFAFASRWPSDAVKYMESLCRIVAPSLLLFEKLLARSYGRSNLNALASEFIENFAYANDTVGLRIALW